MSKLDKIAGKLGQAVMRTAGRARQASLFVKVGLIAIGSAVIAIATFLDFPSTGPTGPQILGILAALIVAVGATFVMITEEDAPKNLALAQEAVEAAREAEARFEIVGELSGSINRLISLYQAQSVMRGVIERLASAGTASEDGVVKAMLKACERLLPITMEFAQADVWTIGIYKAVASPDEGKVDLKCVAHKRAIECSLEEARVWREGTGIAGVAYSNAREVIIPDLHAEGMKAVFGTNANKRREYDTDRYRSMVAVPIEVHGLDKPWGVVAATTDKPGHFSARERPGVKPDEGARALASMVALAVAVMRAKPATNSQVSDSATGTE